MRHVSCFLVLAFVAGCGSGSGDFPTAKVSGKVTCNGKPVPHVRIYFAPIAPEKRNDAGKSGWGTAKEDGTFAVSTYGSDDGAVVGKHRISVDRPHPEMHRDFVCDCETDSRNVLQEVEVVAGKENHFEIALPPGAGGKTARDDEDD